MRKPKNRTNPSIAAFQIGKGRIEPQALQRSPSTNSSKRFDEDTIIWGQNDSLPLEILKAVNDSPVATTCLDLHTDFVKGSGFKNKELENLVVNKNGQTLWELHCQLSDIIVKLEGFSVLHRHNRDAAITNAYYIPFDELRFVKPEDDRDPDMKFVKHNPFWGTVEYQKKFTTTYPLYNPDYIEDYMSEMGKEFMGTIYYFGVTSPLYRFYPRPKYWACERWIKADGKLQMFHDENLENGFFQSTLINVIGNPSAPSSNPKYQREVTGSDRTIRRESTKTVGEEFNEMMSETFSGAKKAGTAMVMWSSNQDSSAKIQAFPTNTNSDLLGGTFTNIIRGITIGTKTPAILANLPQSENSLGSDGASFQKAVEMMQMRTQWQRKQLENYYNQVLLPNLQTPIETKVEILNYQPASMPVEINDKVWEFMNEQEKIDFVKQNFNNIKLYRQPALSSGQTAPQIDPSTGQLSEPIIPPQPAQSGNEALKNLNIANLNKIQKIVSRYNLYKTDPTNPKGITYEQAKQLLSAFGFSEDELNAWLVTPEEDDANT